MEKQIEMLVTKKLEQFYCSILLDEVKEKVRKLKAYGVDEAEIVAAMNEEKLFPQLIVTEDYKVVLAGEQPVEVEMEPLVKAVYLLFLSHPEGIVLKCLPDHRKELTSLYLLLKPNGMTDRAIQSIEDVTNPMLNSINEKCARIRDILEGPAAKRCQILCHLRQARRGEEDRPREGQCRVEVQIASYIRLLKNIHSYTFTYNILVYSTLSRVYLFFKDTHKITLWY